MGLCVHVVRSLACVGNRRKRVHVFHHLWFRQGQTWPLLFHCDFIRCALGILRVTFVEHRHSFLLVELHLSRQSLFQVLFQLQLLG